MSEVIASDTTHNAYLNVCATTGAPVGTAHRYTRLKAIIYPPTHKSRSLRSARLPLTSNIMLQQPLWVCGRPRAERSDVSRAAKTRQLAPGPNTGEERGRVTESSCEG